MFIIKICALIFLMIPQILMAESVTTYITLETKNNKGMSIDWFGNLYVSNLGNLYHGSVFDGVSLYKIDSDGNVTTVSDQLKGPTATLVDSNNSVYVREKNSGTIWKFSEQDGKQPFVQVPVGGFDGLLLAGNDGFFIDEFDQIYVGSTSQGKIFRISSDGIREEYAASSLFSQISTITGDDLGNLYIGQWDSRNIIKVDTNQQVSLFASLPGNSLSLYASSITCVDGMLYATSYGDNKIYRIETNGTVLHFAGTGALNSTDGTKLNASFSGPTGLVASLDGNTLYVSEFESNKIRAIDIYFNDPVPPGIPVPVDNSGGGSMDLIFLFVICSLFLVQLLRARHLYR